MPLLTNHIGKKKVREDTVIEGVGGEGISNAKFLESRLALSSTFEDVPTFWPDSSTPKYISRKRIAFVHADTHWEKHTK